MISTVLVANRGEIACRIFRTCRAQGIRTVAVHSDADATALHTRLADAAVRLPGSASTDTYLRGDLIVKAALAAGADAVHPGYGFLSENAAFARAVTDAGLTWIGPPPEAIEAMASKTRAKKLMGAEPLHEVTEADLPVLVKAAAGGGGRGMRIVRRLADLDAELAAARAEAASAFGDGEVFVEPYVEHGRHVEVQLLADTHGTVWTLGTRDCSLQRRHQKVIEEAPAPGLTDTLTRELYERSVRAARAVDYTGAGTVEFLVAPDGTAHFLEMNTRLQVEHPVTEAVFGVDLVALQLRVAEGHPLGPTPPDPHGHAVEARLYAEDPAAGWAPQTGRLHRLAVPDGIRLDTGYTDGDDIGVHYDPMLAKLVAHAPTRAEAVRRLAGALERAAVHGPVTNRDLLLRSLRHEEFTSARVDTGFYDRHLPALTTPAPDPLAPLAAALADAAGRSRFGGAWRNVPSGPQVKRYALPGGEETEVRYHHTRTGPRADGVHVVHTAPGLVVLETDGVRRRYEVASYGDEIHVGTTRLTALPRFPDPAPQHAPGSLLAPMPGTVVRVAEGLTEGARVAAGQPLLWLEAMKMEHRITAPATGTLTSLHAVTGQQVTVGSLLAVVTGSQGREEPRAVRGARNRAPSHDEGAAT
ncbi:biotin carboxylase N-terminal domain-containing protein [Streptomyces griseoviridis]|uniref:Acetyl-/propionyl-CoA carboxylase subunit alpha n=1 Tax=Streptomyces griseoviridis TaxID=45398 RepID=A0A918GD10_STRGD|nr:biotin carboxylase N-terminal domain-containing protein [Streptomyces niveoruber]GGS29028.1 acetyl-/propionyl-CoA carboxylase subunit alpha [Streptomyces niveoruber]